MKGISASVLLVCAFLCMTTAGQPSLPFRVNRVADRVTIFSPGRYAPEAATVVVTTAKSLILVDTGLSPTLAELTKAKIKQELGRDDVAYVVNTHFQHPGHQLLPGAFA